jgi:small-conductance mechanosensitive channel
MKIARSALFVALLLSTLVAVNSPAQESEDAAAPISPDLKSLQSNWWTYFEGPREAIEPNIDAFLEDVGSQIPGLAPQNQEIAESVLAAVRDNFTAYLDLLDDTAVAPQVLAEPAESYALDELLELAATARDARSNATEAQLEVEREKRILDGTSRRRDATFKDYVDAAAGDERWLVAARLLQARTAQAIAARRLALLTQSFNYATAAAETTAARVELASDRLATTADSTKLETLIERVEANSTAVEKAQEKLRTAEIAASSLDLDAPLGRSQQRLQQQKLVGAEVNLALAEAALAQTTAKRLWTEIDLLAEPDTEMLVDQALAWSEFIRDVNQQATEWQRQTEDELLAVQSINQDGLDRAARRLLDQRLGTAQETLAWIGELDTAIADLELLMLVVGKAAAEYTGAFKSWLANMSLKAKTAYVRVTDLADVTLFSVGEAPVTGADILRFFVILFVAMLLSRGIRHALQRVAGSESSGTQASVYTVSRLTHYLIVILALFIALSSIGLDFGNLALVAGALSVGIGFGLQSIVNNFVSGLIILFEHSLRVGDYIELDTGLTGTVKSINVRSTLINTNDNIDIVVPNSEFVTTRLTNWTLGERILRVRIPFGVAYGSDKDLVKQAAVEAAADVQFTLTNMKGREPDVWLTEFGDNSLNFLLLVWVNRQGAKRPTRTRSAYLWALESKLSEYGIEIPFPQRDLHVRSGWPQPAQPPTYREDED